ncbi:MAG: sugar transferase, partial [Bacteroidota bacterium]|nr:sugar transferase [Bacteroidota bacterium]
MILQNSQTEHNVEGNSLLHYETKQNNKMSFVYIGNDESILEHLEDHFQYGYKKDSPHESAKFLIQMYYENNLLPDVLFIDTPPDDEQLRELTSILKHNILLASIPVIYNQNQLSDIQIRRLKYSSVVDDIIPLNSNHINYSSKILFLKQSKLRNELFGASNPQNEKERERSVNTSYILKRSIDISIASTALLIMSPVLLLIALIIKLESKGSVFYTSLRAGKGFKTFKFYKFRSMVADADKKVESMAANNQYSVNENGPIFFKVSNDPRVTRFGKFLRNVSADELPQLLNVIKGDMSLVGNRPLPIYEAVS